LELAPISQPCSSSTLLPSWVQDGANATVFLNSMLKPRHGKLRLDSTNQWIFTPGNPTDLSQGVLLDDLSANFQNLLDTGQLFKGHSKFRRVYNTRAQLQLKNCVLRHVSAHGLSSLIAPVSLQSHNKMLSVAKRFGMLHTAKNTMGYRLSLLGK